MTNVASTGASPIALSLDGEGRRVFGGPTLPELAAPGEELTFSDFLSVINPLQHIPVVSSIYRWVTGDTIKPAARVIGGALYGGPIGLATAALHAIVEQVKGADLGAQALAALLPPGEPQSEPTQQTATAMPAAEPTGATPEADRAASNLAALQRFAADLRGAADEPAEPKPPEPPPLAPLQPGQPRTLAYYQANAGRRLAGGDTSRYALIHREASPALSHPTSLIPPGSSPESLGKHETPDVANRSESPPAAWFASAMKNGLDRYRTMQQLDKAAPQVDLSR